jgi:chitin disaccharide deacetylase
MRRLIVNADDLGVNPPRSHGIFQCMENGLVTSATLMVNGSDAQAAARRVRERDVPGIGLHLNLTDGSAISTERDVGSLLDAHGFLSGRDHLERAMETGEAVATHLEREIRAQIEWFLDSIGQPTHMDSHHHIHVHPVVARLLPPILQRYGIQRVRLPIETIADIRWEISKERLAYIRAVNARAQAARDLWEGEGLRSTDHFRGMALRGNANAKRLRSLLSSLPEGTTELKVHPGACDPSGDAFSRDPQRETERNMLLDPESHSFARNKGIELISFGDT